MGKGFLVGVGGGRGSSAASENPIIVESFDKLSALLTSENTGKYIKFTGETGEYTTEDNSTLYLTKNATYVISDEAESAQYCELPSLENEGTAADLKKGKELVNSNGEVVVGELETGVNLTKYFNHTLTTFDDSNEFSLGENCDITFAGQKMLSSVNIPNVQLVSMLAFAGCENLTELNANVYANIYAFSSWFYGSTKDIYPRSLFIAPPGYSYKAFISMNGNPYAIYTGKTYNLYTYSSYISSYAEVLYPLFASRSSLEASYTFNSLKCIPTGVFYSVRFRYSNQSLMTINAPELGAIHTSALYFDLASSSYLPSMLILNASKIKYYGASAINIKVAGIQNYELGEYYGYGHFNLYSTDGSTKIYHNDYPNAKVFHGNNFSKTESLNLPNATNVSISGGIGASIPKAKKVNWYNMPSDVALPECEQLYVNGMSSGAKIVAPKVKYFSLYGSGCTEIHLAAFEGDMSLTTTPFSWYLSPPIISCSTLEYVDCPKCSKNLMIGTQNLKSITLDDYIASLSMNISVASNCSIRLANTSLSCFISAGAAGGLLDITLSDCSYAYINGEGIGTVTLTGAWTPKQITTSNVIYAKSIKTTFSTSTSIGYSISNNDLLENVSVPGIGVLNVMNCTKLTDLYMPAATAAGGSAFLVTSGCSMLSAVIFTSYLSRIVSYAFSKTPISDSTYLGYYGSIYVPASLVSSYRIASGWSFYSSRITSISDLPAALKQKYELNDFQ